MSYYCAAVEKNVYLKEICWLLIINYPDNLLILNSFSRKISTIREDFVHENSSVFLFIQILFKYLFD